MNGVYKITNTVNGKVYIGSTTIGFENRWNTHRNLLRTGKHYNKHLQRAWNKYGEGAFTFEIVEQSVDKKDIREKELSWIAKFFGKGCYNVTTKTAGRPSAPSQISHQEVDKYIAELRSEFSESEFLDLVKSIADKFGSVTRFAEYLEQSPSAVSAMLSGRMRLSGKTLEKLGYRRVIAFQQIGDGLKANGTEWKRFK